jgi:flagellar hook-associated protein 3 FlgL
MLADIQRAADDLAKWQRQVSSGKRVNAPHDDPAAAMVAISERGELALTESYGDAAAAVESRLTAIDTVLSDLVNQLEDAKVTAAAGRSTILSANQRETLAQQLEGLKAAIAADLNSQFRGTYVFSGTAATTQPYPVQASGTVDPYQGNTSVARVEVNRGEMVQVTFDGDAVARGTDTDNVFEMMDALISAVRTGDMTGIDAGIAGLDRAFDRVTSTQSAVGISLSTLEGQKARIAELRIKSIERISKAEDANLAEAITNMTRAETAQRAALAAAASRSSQSLMDYL